MVATPQPDLRSATATCIAVVDLPEPPFSLPQTMTCALRRFLPSVAAPTPDNNITQTPHPCQQDAANSMKIQCMDENDARSYGRMDSEAGNQLSARRDNPG